MIAMMVPKYSWLQRTSTYIVISILVEGVGINEHIFCPYITVIAFSFTDALGIWKKKASTLIHLDSFYLKKGKKHGIKTRYEIEAGIRKSVAC